MSRVSAEHMFKSHFPNAAIERQTRARFSSAPGCYLVRATPDSLTFSGSGTTKPKAWAAACSHCGITAIKLRPLSGPRTVSPRRARGVDAG